MELLLPREYALPHKLRIVRREVPFLSDADGSILPALLSSSGGSDEISDSQIADRLAQMGYSQGADGEFALASNPRSSVAWEPSVN
jgi:hypothetical protein